MADTTCQPFRMILRGLGLVFPEFGLILPKFIHGHCMAVSDFPVAAGWLLRYAVLSCP